MFTDFVRSFDLVIRGVDPGQSCDPDQLQKIHEAQVGRKIAEGWHLEAVPVSDQPRRAWFEVVDVHNRDGEQLFVPGRPDLPKGPRYICRPLKPIPGLEAEDTFEICGSYITDVKAPPVH